MKRYKGNGDIGTTYINNKEISKSDVILDFYGNILDLSNSVNLLMLANYVNKNIELKLELNKIIEVLNIILNDLGLDIDKKVYRISEHKNLENIIDKYDIKLNGKEKKNIISCKDACLAKDCFIKALKLERSFYKLGIEALFSTYLNRLSTYFDVLRQWIDEENGF
jgi:cob(I)alamin adenosyltransferase